MTAADQRGRGDRPRPSRGLNQTLDEAVRITKQTFAPLFGIQLVAALPAMITLGWGYAALPTERVVDLNVEAFVVTLAITVGLYATFKSISQPLSLAVIYVVAARAHRGQAWSLGGGLLQALRRLWPIIVVGATYYGALFIFAMLGCGGGAALGYAVFLTAKGELGLALGSLMGGMVALVVAVVSYIWVALRYSFATVEVVVDETSKTWGAFARSAVVARGGYVEIAVLAIVLVALQWGLSMVSGIAFRPPTPDSYEVDAVIAMVPALVRMQLVQLVVAEVVQAAFLVFSGACWVVLYFRRRGAVEAVQTRGTTTTPAAS